MHYVEPELYLGPSMRTLYGYLRVFNMVMPSTAKRRSMPRSGQPTYKWSIVAVGCLLHYQLPRKVVLEILHSVGWNMSSDCGRVILIRELSIICHS